MREKFGMTLFWTGFVYAASFAAIAGWNLAHALRTQTADALQQSVWALGEPLFVTWAFSAPLGAILAMVGALLRGKTKSSLVWITGLCVFVVVGVMTIVLGRFYSPVVFGIGGCLILALFFAIVWLWMKRQGALTGHISGAAGFQLVGYVFFFIATWFLCGEFGSMHQLAFAGRKPPSPIEIMVYLVLGWLCLFLSHLQSNGRDAS